MLRQQSNLHGNDKRQYSGLFLKINRYKIDRAKNLDLSLYSNTSFNCASFNTKFSHWIELLSYHVSVCSSISIIQISIRDS